MFFGSVHLKNLVISVLLEDHIGASKRSYIPKIYEQNMQEGWAYLEWNDDQITSTYLSVRFVNEALFKLFNF